MKQRSKLSKTVLSLITTTFAFVSFLFATPTTANAAQPMVAAGGCHTVGLKSDGMVAAVEYNSQGQLDVSTWTDIVQIAAGSSHTIGLKSDYYRQHKGGA